MRLFFEITKQSLRRYFAYRMAAFAGLVTNFFFGLVRVAILLALYGNRQDVEGYTVSGVITYTGLTQAIIAYLSMFGWYDLMNSVHSGEVATDLLKPMNYFAFWMAQDLGRALVNFILRGITIMVLYALIFDLVYPQTAVHWLFLIITIILSWLTSFVWRFLINLPAFWSPNAKGFGRFGFVLAWFFSGFLMPLRFFPEWVIKVAYLTPFPYMLNTVVEVYLGVLTGTALLETLVIELLWVLGMVVIAQAILRTAVRRLVILGG